MIWKGPGVLKFGYGLDAVYLEPDTKIPEDFLVEMKKTGSGKKNFEQLIADGKISETTAPEPKTVKRVKKK